MRKRLIHLGAGMAIVHVIWKIAIDPSFDVATAVYWQWSALFIVYLNEAMDELA